MKVKMTLSIGFPVATRKEIIELDDDMTDDELHEEWELWSNNYIDGGFEIIHE